MEGVLLGCRSITRGRTGICKAAPAPGPLHPSTAAAMTSSPPWLHQWPLADVAVFPVDPNAASTGPRPHPAASCLSLSYPFPGVPAAGGFQPPTWKSSSPSEAPLTPSSPATSPAAHSPPGPPQRAHHPVSSLWHSGHRWGGWGGGTQEGSEGSGPRH